MSHRLPRRALLIVDVEPAFLTPITKHIVPTLIDRIVRGRYGAFVVAEYTDATERKHATTKTQWERQYGALHRGEETIPALKNALEGRTVIRVVKSTRSLFGSDALLATKLRRRGIQEVHIAGLETHDCVLATAFDAFDHGFRTFVLADVCASKQVRLHRAAHAILRRAKLLR